MTLICPLGCWVRRRCFSTSSIRLDNYIYTLESLREAKRHLRGAGGTVCLSFALGGDLDTERSLPDADGSL